MLQVGIAGGMAESDFAAMAAKIRSGEGFANALENLTTAIKTRLHEKVGSALIAELAALSLETDEHLFRQGALKIALRQRAQQRLPQATAVLGMLASVPSVVSTQAQIELEAISGQGHAGYRSEFLLSQLTKQATDYRTIVPMVAGSLAFSAGRAWALSRMVKAPAGALTRGFGARLASSSLGFAVEVPTFALGSRALLAMCGEKRETGIPHDLASAAITLGALKGMGFVGGQALYRLRARSELAPLSGMEKLIHGAVPQIAAGMGMMLGHRAEEIVGLRAPMDRATSFLDTVSTLMSLHVGIKGAHFLTPGLKNFETSLGQRAEIYYQQGKSNAFASPNQASQPQKFSAIPRLDIREDLERYRLRAGAGNVTSPRFATRSESVLNNAMLVQMAESKAGELRDYQVEMLNALERDFVGKVSPWLALASPMQTGKSHLIGPMIRMLQKQWGEDTQFIILSSSKVITSQLIQDLVRGFSAEEIGRFDGAVKDPRPITVASYLALAKNLKDYPVSPRTVLINDEAFFTRSRSIRRIYAHFGLGEEVRGEQGPSFRPKEGQGLVIGFSGTGFGLEGYHTSAHYELLSAIEAGWIREMKGERMEVAISSQKENGAGGEKMIWWKATRENAAVLADLYHEKFYGRFGKNLIFVPTIKHGRLLKVALEAKGYKDHPVHFVHSGEGMADSAVEKGLAAWLRGGGAMISVRKLSRGFRGGETEAVFHTYQTTSAELFSQRTGRAWGTSPEKDQAPLYVFEVAWSKASQFANLAKILGFVDYPQGGEFTTQDGKGKIREARLKKNLAEEKNQKIERKEISPLFAEVPMAMQWRQAMESALEAVGGIAKMSEATGLPQEIVGGFALGALPTDWATAEVLSGQMGGREKTMELWVSSWRGVVEGLLSGTEKSLKGLDAKLTAWSKNQHGIDDDAASLEKILGYQYRKTVPQRSNIQEKNFRAVLRRIDKVTGGMEFPQAFLETAKKEAAAFRDTIQSPIFKLIFDNQFLGLKPPMTQLLRKNAGNPDWVGAGVQSRSDIVRQVKGLIQDYADWLIRRHLTHVNVFMNPISTLGISHELRKKLLGGGIRTVGDLVQHGERYVPRNDRAQVNQLLGSMNLKFGPFPAYHLLEDSASRPDFSRPWQESFLALAAEAGDIVRLSNSLSMKTERLGEFCLGILPTFLELGEINLKARRLGVPSWEGRFVQSFTSLVAEDAKIKGLAVASGVMMPEVGQVEQRILESVNNLKVGDVTKEILSEAAIATIGELVAVPREKVERYDYFAREVDRALARMGLKLGMQIPGLPNIPDFKILQLGRLLQERFVERLDFFDSLGSLQLMGLVRTRLEAANIRLIGELVQFSESELMEIPFMGKKSVDQIKLALQEHGFKLGTKIPEGGKISKPKPASIQIPAVTAASESISPILYQSVDQLRLPVRAAIGFQLINIKLIGELVQFTPEALLRIKSFGKKSLSQVQEVLGKLGLHLGMRIPNWGSPQEEKRLDNREVSSKDLMYQSLSQLFLKPEVRATLENANIRFIGQLVQFQGNQLRGIQGFDEAALQEVEGALAKLGLNLRKSGDTF